MKKPLFLALLICLSNSLFSQDLQWIRSFGPNTTVQVEAQKIIRDNAGNIYVGGRYRGTVDFDPGAGVYEITSAGGFDAFLMKVDASGNFIWARSWGNSSAEEVDGLEVDASNNLYVAGVNGLIKKFASDGSLIWTKTIPGSEAGGIKILNNNLYITGAFSNTITYTTESGTQSITSNGSRDVYIMKADTSNQIIWLKRVGGSDNDQAFCLQTTNDGKVVVGGKYRSTVDFDPGAGIYNLTSSNVDEAFIMQLDTNGNFQWANGFIGSGNSSLNSIAVDNSNNVYCVGDYTLNLDLDPTTGQDIVTSAGSDDIFYLKLNSAGNVIWRKTIGGSSNDWGTQIALDAQGRLIISGQYTSANVNFDAGGTNFTHSCNGAGNVYFISASLDGQFLNAGFIQGTSLIDILSFHPLSEGGFLMSGSYNYCGNGCDFDPGNGTQDLPALIGVARHAYFGKYSNITPLALNLLDIKAERLDKGNRIYWITTDEAGVLEYEIEVGFNGTDFKRTGTVTAHNYVGIQKYDFIDRNAADYSQTAYYRIKMINQDYSYKYSKIVPLSVNPPDYNAITIFPNPANDFILLKGSKESDSILIREICGKTVAFHSTNSGNTERKIDVSALSPGLYILSITRNDGTTVNVKFAKQ